MRCAGRGLVEDGQDEERGVAAEALFDVGEEGGEGGEGAEGEVGVEVWVGVRPRPERVAVDGWLNGVCVLFQRTAWSSGGVRRQRLTTKGVSFTRSFSSSRMGKQKLMSYGSEPYSSSSLIALMLLTGGSYELHHDIAVWMGGSRAGWPPFY